MDTGAKTMLLGIAFVLASGSQLVADAARGWSTEPLFVGVGLVIVVLGYPYGVSDAGADRDHSSSTNSTSVISKRAPPSALSVTSIVHP